MSDSNRNSGTSGQRPKILIFGSCVSRDILNSPSAKVFELVDYFARSSLAIFASGRPVSEFPLDQIDSSFQRRMVCRDLNKSFLSTLEQIDFDILLIDLIDERFSLCEISDNCFVTVSNEFLKAKIPCVMKDEVRRVTSGTDEFKAIWEAGVEVLFSSLLRLGLIDKVYINCVHWADRLENAATPPPAFSNRRVQPANELLEWMYGKLGHYLPSYQFLTFDPSLFVGSKDHVWGISPFHYVDRYYEEATMKISSIANRLAIRQQTSAEVWHFFNSNRSELINDACSFIALSDIDIDEILTGSVDEIYSGDDVWKTHFSLTEVAKIEALISRMATPKFRDELLLQACQLGRLQIPSLFGGEGAICAQSLYVQNRNFLRFLDNGATFYLIQHHKFARAIYFPLRSVAIVLDVIALPKSAIFALNRELVRKFPAYLRNSNQRHEANFLGVLASYPRPYHFFYDTLPVVFHVHRHVVPVSGLPAIIQLQNGAFIPIAEFLNSPEKQLTLSDGDALNSHLLQVNGFCFQLGYGTRRNPDFDDLDAALIKFGKMKTEKDIIFSEKIEQAESCYPLVWFGICSEKRSWKEQVEGISLIINRLSAKYPNLGVVFDGITSTYVQEPETVREMFAANELDVIQQIKTRLLRQVPAFDLVGANSAIKIAFSGLVTSFLTNFLTDSMYVARIGRKPGVAHGAKGAMYSDHQHPYTYFVPKNWVTDEPSALSNWSAISYSMEPELVSGLFDQVISSHQWDIPVHSIFSAIGKSIIRKLRNGYEILNESDGRPEYLSVNGNDLRFDACAADSVKVSAGTVLDFYFRGRVEGDLTANLTVIAHNGTSRCFTETVPLGYSKRINFPLDATSYRLFIRLSGLGRALVRQVEAMPCPANEGKRIKAAGQLSILQDRLARWKQPIFEYASIKDFVSAVNSLASGIHRIALSDKWLELNFYRNDEPNLVIFFNGNVSRTSNTLLPAFSGMGALGALKANVLMVNDPSLYYSDDLSLAWYAGADDLPLQHLLPSIFQPIASKFGERRTILYGGSGGGFAALHYAKCIKNAIAVVCNPQTDLTRYNKESVERYVNKCLGGVRQEDALAKLFSIKDINYKSSHAFIDGEYKVIYIQNKLDSHHWNNHFLPFLDEIGLEYVPVNGQLLHRLAERVSLIVSDQWGAGHTAAPKKFIFGLLGLLIGDYSEVEFSETLDQLHTSTISLVEKCVLKVTDNRFVCSVSLANGSDVGSIKFAWYLYKDGVRIEIKPYAGDQLIRFETSPEPGIYWVVAFLRIGDFKQVVRSNKNYGK